LSEKISSKVLALCFLSGGCDVFGDFGDFGTFGIGWCGAAEDAAAVYDV
jgi:hypothetical protein